MDFARGHFSDTHIQFGPVFLAKAHLDTQELSQRDILMAFSNKLNRTHKQKGRGGGGGLKLQGLLELWFGHLGEYIRKRKSGQGFSVIFPPRKLHVISLAQGDSTGSDLNQFPLLSTCRGHDSKRCLVVLGFEGATEL